MSEPQIAQGTQSQSHEASQVVLLCVSNSTGAPPMPPVSYHFPCSSWLRASINIHMSFVIAQMKFIPILP